MLASPRLVSRHWRRFFCSGTRGVPLAAALALGLAAGSAGATPSSLLGAGPRGVALVGGGAALPLGPESVLVNPAGLAATPAKVLVFGLRASNLALTLDHGGRTEPYAAELSKGLLIGVAAPLVPPSADGWRASLGLFAETPPDFLVRAHLPLAGQASFPLIVGRAGALDLGVGLGVGLGRLALGAGVEVLAALSGRDVVAGAGGAPGGVTSFCPRGARRLVSARISGPSVRSGSPFAASCARTST